MPMTGAPIVSPDATVQTNLHPVAARNQPGKQFTCGDDYQRVSSRQHQTRGTSTIWRLYGQVDSSECPKVSGTSYGGSQARPTSPMSPARIAQEFSFASTF